MKKMVSMITLIVLLMFTLLGSGCGNSYQIPDAMVQTLGLPAGTVVEIDEEIIIKLGLEQLRKENTK